jgi:rare lipoprotein A
MQPFLKKIYIVCLFFFMSAMTFAQDAETGIAAYYSDEFNGGSTASGEPYDKTKLTAAHNSIAFGTMIKVTNLTNGKSVRVRVNDRGPYIKGRIVDVSGRAAKVLGMISAGEARVKVEISGEDDAPLADAKDETPKEDIPKEYNNNETLSSRGNSPSYVEDSPKKAVRIGAKISAPVATVVKKKAVKLKKNTTSVIAEIYEPNDITIETDISNYKNSHANLPKSYENYILTPKGTNKAVPKSYETAVLVKGKDFKTFDLYQIKLLRPEKKGFGVQVAAMDTYEAALKEVAQYQGLMYENVLVSVEKGKDGHPDYKVIIGPYTDKKAAEVAKNALIKKVKSKGFIVDLAAR